MLLKRKIFTRLTWIGITSLLWISMDAVLADEVRSSSDDAPWLTGPLLANPALVEPPGKFDIEPYFFITKNDTNPTIYSFSPQLSFTVGVSKRVDTQFVVPYNFNEVNGYTYQHVGDIVWTVGVQCIDSPNNSWIPNVRLVLQQTFPSGKFENLNPLLMNGDLTGQGVYNTGFGANIGQLFELPNGQFLHVLLNLVYGIPDTFVSVHGLDAYGGDVGVEGTIYPSNNFLADFAFEYTLTAHWALAMDATYASSGASGFNGIFGVNARRNTLLGTRASEVATLAPALEYNFSTAWGIIAGAWFTIYAHNANPFVSGVIAVNYGLP